MTTANTTQTRRPVAPVPPPPATPATAAGVQFARPPSASGQRIGIYGPGGIGKTSLVAQFPGKIAFFDLDESLPRLAKVRDSESLVVVPGSPAHTWATMKAALNAPGWDGIDAIVIDTGTKAEELAIAHTLATVTGEKGCKVNRLEDYGYGKGFTYVFETFMELVVALDRHVRAGRHVIIVCHDCTTNMPNPMGDDWIRWEPRLQSPASGKASIRLRLREWCDHLIYVGYDIDVKDGKARGSSTRTLYPTEMPHCMAKSRTLRDPIPLTEDSSEVWQSLLA